MVKLLLWILAKPNAPFLFIIIIIIIIIISFVKYFLSSSAVFWTTVNWRQSGCRPRRRRRSIGIRPPDRLWPSILQRLQVFETFVVLTFVFQMCCGLKVKGWKWNFVRNVIFGLSEMFHYNKDRVYTSTRELYDLILNKKQKFLTLWSFCLISRVNLVCFGL